MGRLPFVFFSVFVRECIRKISTLTHIEEKIKIHAFETLEIIFIIPTVLSEKFRHKIRFVFKFVYKSFVKISSV